MDAVDVAFLHGGGQGGWVWQDTVDALAVQAGEGFARTLLLDVPGCGAKRDRRTDDISVADIADELIEDVEKAGMRDVLLVGHSQAGSVLPTMLERRPGLFRRAVYVSCSIPSPGQTVQGMIGSGVQGNTGPDEVGWPVDPASVEPRELFAALFCNDMGPELAADFLPKLGHDMWPAQSYAHTDWRHGGHDAVPASYVLCLADAILPAAWQERFAERFGATRVTRIDAGHQVMVTRPHALAEVLRAEV